MFDPEFLDFDPDDALAILRPLLSKEDRHVRLRFGRIALCEARRVAQSPSKRAISCGGQCNASIAPARRPGASTKVPWTTRSARWRVAGRSSTRLNPTAGASC